MSVPRSGDSRTKIRRSVHFIPANNWRFVEKGAGLGCDLAVLDLEDSVPPEEKAHARDMAKKAIEGMAWKARALAVRVNPVNTSLGVEDLGEILRVKVDAVVLPKVSLPGEAKAACRLVEEIEGRLGRGRPVDILATVETALGMINVEAIAGASRRITGLIFGAADYLADVGGEISSDMIELLYPRSRLAVAAAAAGIDAIDSAYLNVEDLAGLEKDTRLGRRLGFKGRITIHPRQIEVVNRVHSPGEGEVSWARRVVEAYEKARAEGKGAVRVNGAMVDEPVVRRARRILELSAGAP